MQMQFLPGSGQPGNVFRRGIRRPGWPIYLQRGKARPEVSAPGAASSGLVDEQVSFSHYNFCFEHAFSMIQVAARRSGRILIISDETAYIPSACFVVQEFVL